MKATFLGHESWLLTAGEVAVAIDPVLRGRVGFGHPVSYPLEPARGIVVDQVPALSAIVITSDHFDHIDLESLHRLDRRTPVFASPLLPEVAAYELEVLGFALHRQAFGRPWQLGGLQLALFRPRPTERGHSRDAQLLAWSPDEPGASFYLAGTSPISDEYRRGVRAETLPCARLLVASTSRSDGVAAELATVPAFREHTTESAVVRGIRDDSRELGVDHVVSCGDGLALPRVGWKRDLGGPTRGTEAAIAEPAFGALPGDMFDLSGTELATGKASYVELFDPEGDPEPDESESPRALTPRPSTDRALRHAFDRVVEFLPTLARELSLRPPWSGSAQPTFDTPADGLGPYSMMLGLLGGPSGLHQYALDVARTRFNPVPERPTAMVERYPVGILCHALDLDAVLRGELCIWDVAACAMQAWDQGGEPELVVHRFCELFGSRYRPELARTYFSARSLTVTSDFSIQYLEHGEPVAPPVGYSQPKDVR